MEVDVGHTFSLASHADLNVTVNRLHLVHLEPFGRRTGNYAAVGDIEPRTVALAHERRPFEPAAGERACLLGADTEVVERVQAAIDAGDGDSTLEVTR
jgi:hypothetical protein